jgi:hypothetical protein
MSGSVAKKLVRYRSWIVAIVNGVITWIVLIIAPLGLLAVVICTLLVFLGSLLVGSICDRALFKLWRESDRDVMLAHRESEGINFATENSLDLPTQERKKADD